MTKPKIISAVIVGAKIRFLVGSIHFPIGYETEVFEETVPEGKNYRAANNALITGVNAAFAYREGVDWEYIGKQ